MGNIEKLTFLYKHRIKCLEKIKALNESARDIDLSHSDEVLLAYSRKRDALFNTLDSINNNIKKIHLREKINENIFTREASVSVNLMQDVFNQDDVLEEKIKDELQVVRKGLSKRKDIKRYVENI